MADAATQVYRMVSNKKQSDSNIDHTYCITLLTQDEPLYHINYHSTQHAMGTGETLDVNCCKMLSMKIKHLKEKLAVLLAQQEKKETSQACVQTDLIAVTTRENLNKQLMSKYEQALKEIHKWKVQCKTLQKLKSEPSTTQTKEADVNSRSEVDKVYCQLAACCTERDQYKSQVEQLKQQISQMDSEMRQYRIEVEQQRKETQNTASASTSRDERECRVPKELEDDDGIMHATYKKTHKRLRCPSSELNLAPVKKPHVSVSETGVLPYGNYNSDNFTIHEKDSTPNPNMAITDLERLTTGSKSTVSTLTTRAVMNIKAECGGYINVHASQQVPATSDIYNCNDNTKEMENLYQSSIPAVDLNKEYYSKYFEELSVKVKHLENLLAATLVQQVKKKTSQAAIQTGPISEPMEDKSRMQLVSQYEQAIKKVQILKRLYITLQKPESKLGSTPAKKAEVQRMSEVDKMAIRADRVFRQLDACCTERDLYKSEVEQLNQQNSQLDAENSTLRTEVEKLRTVTHNKTSTNTSRDKSTKLWNLRRKVARLLTILTPDLNFGNLSCDVDAVDGILQQVLKGSEISQ